MRPITFSNAMVGAVGAYAEVVAEQAATIERLEAALRTATTRAAAAKPIPAPGSPAEAVIEAARAVVERWDLPSRIDPPSPLPSAGPLVATLKAALAAFDKAGEEP